VGPRPPGRRARSPLACVLLLLAALAPAAAAAADLDALAAEAGARGLAARPEWKALLHVKRGLLGERSLVDAPAFFLAADGKTNPGAELRATLAAMLRPAGEGDQHALCRFPARAAWLCGQLGLDPADLPAPDCAEYRAYLAEVDPRGVVLVFPVGYSNSPATMFGHTLLRLDAAAESELLDTAVSYAARTDASVGPFFAVKGLFGLYDGFFYVNRYYEKITEYSHLESRDIWEYRLDLGPAEAERLARHLWELRDLGSRYFFFDENCASNLLLLLEVARPGLELEDGSTLWALPLDTVRRVIGAGLVTGRSYRPSRMSRLAALSAPLPPQARELAVAIAAGSSPPEAALAAGLDATGQARVLDAAAELHQGSYFAHRLSREAYAPRLIDILRVRSGLPAVPLEVPEPPAPEEGHDSLLVAAGGAVVAGDAALALRVRPVYHGILDPRPGYQEGAAISFGDTLLLDGPGEGLRLERFSLVEILSLVPVDSFHRSASWRLSVGFEREPVAGGGTRMPFAASWGAGGTVRAGKALMLYGLPAVEGRAGGAFEHGGALGLGLYAGAVATPTERWTLHLEAGAQALLAGERSGRARLALGQGLSLGRNRALELEVAREWAEGVERTELRLMLDLYR